MNSSTQILIELYRRKQFEKIPVFRDETGWYYLSKPQIKTLDYIFDPTTFYVGYGGSGMSGKTQLECFYLQFNALAYPDTRYLFGRKELKNLRLTSLQTLFKTFKFYGVEREIDYTYDGKDNIITFKNGSKIILKDTIYNPSDEEYTSLGSLDLTAAIVDESGESPEKVINVLTSRVGRWNNDKNNIKPFILEGFNPLKNHLYNRYWKPFRDNKETVDRKFVRALCTDNPNPEAKVWAENVLKSGDKRMIERLYYGNFDYDDDDNALCNFDKINDIFTNSFVGKDDQGKPIKSQKFMSCDIAISNDGFVIVNWDGWIIEDIQCIKNISPTKIEANTDGTVNNIIDYTPLINLMIKQAEKYQVPRSNVVYDADGIGSKVRNYFPGAVPLHNNSAPLHLDYKNLKCELEYVLAEKINANEIYCRANLTSELKERIITELQMIKRSTDVGEKLAVVPKAEIKKLLGHSPDILDAIKYRILFYLTRRC